MDLAIAVGITAIAVLGAAAVLGREWWRKRRDQATMEDLARHAGHAPDRYGIPPEADPGHFID